MKIAILLVITYLLGVCLYGKYVADIPNKCIADVPNKHEIRLVADRECTIIIISVHHIHVTMCQLKNDTLYHEIKTYKEVKP